MKEQIQNSKEEIKASVKVNKRVLIISPHFPPVNAADMHRVRQCLPYLKENGWEAEVIAVDPAYIESYSKDELLSKTFPPDTKVHYITAWDVNFTRKVGLGSLSMRSFFHYRRKGNELLKTGKFDLVFFSTTAFHVMALGPYWKRKFKVPFVMDMQDPWRNDFYLSKPKSERPPKFIIAYTIDKILEARTIPFADAIVSVSKTYCETFENRYKNFDASKCAVIPFGGVPEDFRVMEQQQVSVQKIQLRSDQLNIVYIGRGGYDMKFALQLFFKAIRKGLRENAELFKQIHCWFIGTSYAKEGDGIKTIEPLAKEEKLDGFVTEITDRIPYFETLALLKKADILFVPGSTDTGYTASKIYPYILAGKPLLACFHKTSSVVEVLHQTKAGEVITFDQETDSPDTLVTEIYKKLNYLLLNKNNPVQYDQSGFQPYTAEAMTIKLTDIFNEVIFRG